VRQIEGPAGNTMHMPARGSIPYLVLLLTLLGGLASGQGERGPAIVGWRGDGSGKYPVATPPVTWGRVSKAVQGLRFQAARPKGSDTGVPMTDGVIREWLVLSPAPPGTKADKEIVPNEAELSPAEHERVGDAQWKKVTPDTAWLDFSQLISKTDPGIALAATHVYSEAGGRFLVNVTQLGGFRIVLNGKSLPAGYGRYQFDLVKGWNRLLLKVAPHETGWACTLALHARAPAEFEDTNLVWSLPLPGVHGGFYGGGTGCGSPVLARDRMYLQSEPYDLICISRNDGKVQWVRTNSFFDAAAEEDKKKPAYSEAEALARKLGEINASLSTGPLPGKQLEEKAKLETAISAKMQEVDPARYKKYETPDVGFSGFTPICDGKRLYVWYGSGVTACYDLEGNRLWIRADPLPSVEHGFSSSPLLVDGKIIVFMRDVFAFDSKTGKLAWRIPIVAHEGFNPGGYFHGTPARADIGGIPLVVLGNGTILRAADGKILFTHPEMGNQAISSPLVEGNRLLETSTGSMRLFIHTLPAAVTDPLKPSTQIVPVATPAFPHYYMPWHMASPLVHQGLAYLVNNTGVLTVVDLKDGKVLYQKMLDLDEFQTANEGASRGIGISPALAGKYLYFLGNNGAAVVLEPGRTFKQVAKNKIENIVSLGHWGERQERFVANPVFDGNRLYIRGEGHLYCIASGAIRSGGAVSREEGPKPVAVPKAAPLPPPAAGPPEAELLPSSYFGWRRNGTGRYPDATPPVEWTAGKNIKWQARVGSGNSSPVISGDRVLVTSEPGLIHCVSRTDGKLLWTADLQAEGPEPARTKERARPTPVTDGKDVYASFSNGVVACYSLEGKRRWLTKVLPAPLTYGPSASPVLVDGKLLVDSTRLTALDPATGKEIWKAAEGESHYGTPAVLSLGGTLLAVSAKGTVIRISDGAVLGKEIAPGLGGDQAPTPVAQGAVVYFTYRRSSAVRLDLADGKIRPEKLWEQELPGDVISSPILSDGMLFVATSGSPEYRVLNAATGEILLEKELDLNANLYPSLALAGKHLFLGNDKGDMLVLEPSRVYKEIRHNDLPDGSGASPAFAGPHLLLRGGEILYCIGP
jgi:outer membrane protein assembly factor BamB